MKAQIYWSLVPNLQSLMVQEKKITCLQRIATEWRRYAEGHKDRHKNGQYQTYFRPVLAHHTRKHTEPSQYASRTQTCGSE